MDLSAENRISSPYRSFTLPAIFDGPTAAIAHREMSRLLEERGIRILVPTLLAVNALIAYALLTMPRMESEFDKLVGRVVLAQWLSAYAIGFVMVAARSGTAISIERSRDTWTLLRSSPARPIALVAGYATSAVSVAVMVTVSQLPILVPFTFSAPESTIRTLALSAIAGFLSWVACAAWCIWISVAFRRTSATLTAILIAVFWSIGSIQGWIASLLTTLSMKYSALSSLTGPIVDFCILISPARQIITIVSTGGSISNIWAHAPAMLVNIAIPIYFATRAIRRESDTLNTETGQTSTKARRSTNVSSFEIDEVHPIYALERRAARPTGGRLERFGMLGIAVYAITIGLAAGSVLPFDVEHLIVFFFILLGMALWRTAVNVTANRERGAFEMVAMTGLRPHEIVRDLAYAGTMSLLPLGAAIVMSGLAAATGPYLLGKNPDQESIAVFYVVLITFALCVLPILTCGLFASIAGKDTREAVVISAILTLVMYFGVPLLVVGSVSGLQEAVNEDLFGVAEFLDGAISPIFENIETVAACTGPYFGFLSLIDSGNDIPRWTWFVSMGVGAAWTCIWYIAAVWLMRKRLSAQRV